MIKGWRRNLVEAPDSKRNITQAVYPVSIPTAGITAVAV